MTGSILAFKGEMFGHRAHWEYRERLSRIGQARSVPTVHRLLLLDRTVRQRNPYLDGGEESRNGNHQKSDELCQAYPSGEDGSRT